MLRVSVVDLIHRSPGAPTMRRTNLLASTQTMRLTELHTQSAFYTPLEERFERIARLARRLLRVPVAAIELVEETRVWFKAVEGWNITELPLESTFSGRVVGLGAALTIEDASADAQFASHPLVAKGPKFRFYAGLPLLGSRREVIGTLSVYDLQARSLSADDLQALRDLADIAEKELLSIELLDAQAQLVQKLGATRRRASLDALTKVWTRAAGEALLRVALEQSMQRQTPIAVGMLDIDHFKNINDEFGHPTGDRVLQHAVKAVVGALRDQDTICRWGGDEFLLILEDVSQDDLAAIAARIRERVRLSKIRIQTGLIPITVSVGITVAIPDGDSLEIGGWLERADLALLRCKKRGRDAVVIDAPSRPPEQTRFANTTTATLAGQ